MTRYVRWATLVWGQALEPYDADRLTTARVDEVGGRLVRDIERNNVVLYLPGAIWKTTTLRAAHFEPEHENDRRLALLVVKKKLFLTDNNFIGGPRYWLMLTSSHEGLPT